VSYAWHHEAWIAFPSRWEQLGDGSVHTTASDLASWAEHLRAGPLIADRAFVEAQLSGGEQLDNLPPEIDNPCRYAAGLVVVDQDDRQIVYHSGNWVGYWSAFCVDRTAGTSVMALANGAARNDVYKIGFDALDAMALSNRQHGQGT
jgi:Beta-lactamase